jgi:CHC2 zinc finger
MGTKIGRFRPELLPSPSAFYSRELRNMGRRNPKGWVRALCPFHPDSRPSLHANLQTGGFYCFSCGAKGGDVLDFVMMRDALPFKSAARVLGAWGEHQNASAQQIRELQLNRDRERRVKEAQLAEERRRRLEACDYLHLLERLYQEDCNRL